MVCITRKQFDKSFRDQLTTPTDYEGSSGLRLVSAIDKYAKDQMSEAGIGMHTYGEPRMVGWNVTCLPDTPLELLICIDRTKR